MTVEEFMHYELPTADTLRQRLAQGEPLLSDTDIDAFWFPFELYKEKAVTQYAWFGHARIPEDNAERIKRLDAMKPTFYKGVDLLKRMADGLTALSPIFGTCTNALAYDFLSLSRKADDFWNERGELWEKDIDKVIKSANSDEFARECFISGKAKPETPATYAVLADTLAAAEAARDAATANDATLAEIKAQGDRIEATGDETRGLVGEIRTAQMTKKERRRLAGMAGAAKGAGATSPKIIKARDAAARDLQEACGKVKGLIDKGSSLDAACREVCDQFRELPGSKKGGKTWEPLLSARLDAKGSRIKMVPTSLMRRYGEWCKENGLPLPREQVKQAKTKKHGQ